MENQAACRHEFKDGYRFGFGLLHQVDLFRVDAQQKFHPLSARELINVAEKVGWSNGCPRVREVIDSSQTVEDLQSVIANYRASNYWFSHITFQARLLNPFLYDQFTTSIPRLPMEQVTKYDAASVPVTYKDVIFPMSGIYGYASPRVIMEWLKIGKGVPIDKVMMANRLIKELVRSSDSPVEFLTMLSERVVLEGVDPPKVLHHTLSVDILSEENCQMEYCRLITGLALKAPLLTKIYTDMSDEERVTAGVADYLVMR